MAEKGGKENRAAQGVPDEKVQWTQGPQVPELLPER
jgi:hypothetical protein